jgi:hypothetical protein
MPKKKIETEEQKVEEAEVIVETPINDEAETPTEDKNETSVDATEEQKVEGVPTNVEKLMKLYPQYKSFYVTNTGFVHPIEAPKYLIKDAVLYKNKYYKS